MPSSARVARVFWSEVWIVFLTLVILIVTCSSAFAENTSERKLKNRVAPAYPEIARKMNLAGTVKLEIVVTPNGAVKETKVIGGHPILVPAAVDAVKKWRFEPAPVESTGTVEIKFDPSTN